MSDKQSRNPAHRRSLRRHIRKRTAPGAPPGQVLPDPAAHPTSLHLTLFDGDQVTEVADASIADVTAACNGQRLMWLDVVGLQNLEILEAIAQTFSIHPLVKEDIVNVHQRAKTENYDRQLYVVLHLVRPLERFETEQISMVIGQHYLLTFQEVPDDSFAALRARLRGGRMRRPGPDHLAYAVIDAALDGYFPRIELLGDQLEALEDAIVRDPGPAPLQLLFDLRHQLLAMRRTIWPHRDMVNALLREGEPAIRPDTQIYLRDCYDHAVRLMDLVETYRELAADMLELHLSSQSNRLNEIMKVLTIIATIFIPLSFVASLYGMNFDTAASGWNMPELKWRYGYLAVLGVMAVAALGMLYFFWRRGWLGRRD